MELLGDLQLGISDGPDPHQSRYRLGRLLYSDDIAVMYFGSVLVEELLTGEALRRLCGCRIRGRCSTRILYIYCGTAFGSPRSSPAVPRTPPSQTRLPVAPSRPVAAGGGAPMSRRGLLRHWWEHEPGHRYACFFPLADGQLCGWGALKWSTASGFKVMPITNRGTASSEPLVVQEFPVRGRERKTAVWFMRCQTCLSSSASR